MIEKIDWQEVKKLMIFIITVILTTLVISLLVKGLPGSQKSLDEKQANYKLAQDSETESDKSLNMENYEAYQLRDPFTPLALPDSTQNERNLASGASKKAPKVERVYSEKRKEKARVNYNGKSMVVTEKQSIGSFKVIDIRLKDKKVVLIYGDEKITVKQSKAKPKAIRRKR